MHQYINNHLNNRAITKKAPDYDPLLKEVPDEYFNENFHLNKKVFLVTSKEQALTLNDDLSRYLEIVENNLVRNI